MRGPGATAAGATSTNLAGGSSSISNGSGASWAAWFDPWAGSLPLDPDAMLSHQVGRHTHILLVMPSFYPFSFYFGCV
jgi:hypothetical protein